MAITALQTAPVTVRIEDYLENFSYRSDVEFVDGELRERPMAGSSMAFCGAYWEPGSLTIGKSGTSRPASESGRASPPSEFVFRM
jgi:hypothetical protein